MYLIVTGLLILANLHNDKMQDAFEKRKALIAIVIMSAYSVHNKRYDIYTNASDNQLGAVLMQEGHSECY